MDFPKQQKTEPISCVYIIFCKDLSITDEYVGRTTNLMNRMATHKGTINNQKATNYHLKLYEKMRETGGFANWEYNILEKCDDFNKLKELETNWIDKLEPTLNGVPFKRTS